MPDGKQHVVAGYSTCPWSVKQSEDMLSGSIMVMCDKNPNHAACQGATAFPTHLACKPNMTECTELGKGYKPTSEIQKMISNN